MSTRRDALKLATLGLAGTSTITPLQGAEPAGNPQRNWLAPKALRPGDTIAFAAPAGPAGEKPVLAFADILKKAGFHILIPDGLFGRR
jgi:muramoyltetrapeptide carboxypeptidase